MNRTTREGFGVPNNTISRHAAAYAKNARFVAFLGTFARPVQEVWLPGNDLQDPATWSAPPPCTLKHLHAALLQDYDCTEQPAADLPALPSGAGGSAAANAGVVEILDRIKRKKRLFQKLALKKRQASLDEHVKLESTRPRRARSWPRTARPARILCDRWLERHLARNVRLSSI